MKPVAARWIPYALLLQQPWESAAGRISERRGRLLRLDTDDGHCGWGDCAPLPEAGIDKTAATRCAEECARLDLAAQAAGQPLAAWLAGVATPASIPVNAALGALATLTNEMALAACAAGFTTLKAKVGIAPQITEIARLNALAKTLPAGTRLRLDANGAWDETTAASFVAACRDLPVEAIEEPLHAPTLAALARLQAGTGIALALDESLPRFAVADLSQQQAVRRLVLKPARHGGLQASLALAREARGAGLECVVTSALESACGLLAAAHLAAAIAAGAPQTPAHGLATAAWFAADTGLPPEIRGGRLILPVGPGLGFAPGLS